MGSRIRTRGLSLVDEKGRERIYNGVNYVCKGEKPQDDGIVHFVHPLTNDVLSALAGRGINLLRLGFTWAGIEPEMGKYNTVYLDEIKDVVRRCAKYGIDVYLDWHQDLFSGFGLGVGDGAPAWACLTKKEMKRPKLIWAEGYFFGGAVWDCFDAFWKNETLAGRGLRDRYCDMLTYTVACLSDCENIIGYDVFNEPYPGSLGGKIFRNLIRHVLRTVALNPGVDRIKLLKDLTSGQVMNALSVIDDPKVYHAIIDDAERLLKPFDTGVYYDFLCQAGRAVRRASKDGVLFFENCYYSNLGIPCNVPHLIYPDGTREENLVFGPHGYDLTVDTPLTNEASAARVDFIFAEHKEKQTRMGLPVLVGEWGGMVPGGDAYPALEHLLALFDENKWSHTYWHFSPKLLDSRIFDILSRPYPQAVAGKINRYGYDRETKTFTLTYEGANDIRVPTLVYLPSKPRQIEVNGHYELVKERGAYTLKILAGKGPKKVRVCF